MEFSSVKRKVKFSNTDKLKPLQSFLQRLCGFQVKNENYLMLILSKVVRVVRARVPGALTMCQAVYCSA